MRRYYEAKIGTRHSRRLERRESQCSRGNDEHLTWGSACSRYVFKTAYAVEQGDAEQQCATNTMGCSPGRTAVCVCVGDCLRNSRSFRWTWTYISETQEFKCHVNHSYGWCH